MQLSVIIVSWNTRNLLHDCLASLKDAAKTLQVETEIIVVDNNSHDDSVAMVRQQFPMARLICNSENVGFARANNQAITASQGEYLLLLNSDTVVPPNSLEPLLACLTTQPDVAIAGPVLLNADGSFQASYGYFPSLFSYLGQLLGIASYIYGPYFPSAPPESSQQMQDVDWVGGACLLCRRSAAVAVGLLDERFFMYVEEMEWCYRMKHHGWRVCFTPQAAIIHLGGGSSDTVRPQVLARQWQANLYFLHKHHGLLPASLMRFLVAMVGTSRAFLFAVAALLNRKKKRQWQAKAIENINLALLRAT